MADVIATTDRSMYTTTVKVAETHRGVPDLELSNRGGRKEEGENGNDTRAAPIFGMKDGQWEQGVPDGDGDW